MTSNRIDHATERALRRFLALIADQYELAGAIVYGSRARGTHRPDSAPTWLCYSEVRPGRLWTRH